MAEVRTRAPGAPIWVDFSSGDLDASKSFYEKLFGWQETASDPAFGGYVVCKLNGKDVAGIGPTQGPDQPSAWTVYLATDDADETARKVTAAGGKVAAPPMDVAEQGRMAIFQDPAGAFFGVWQPRAMTGAQVHGQPNSMTWIELTSRDIDRAGEFYRQVFGWVDKPMSMGEGMGDYHLWHVGDENVSGGMATPPTMPPEVPSYWMVYFAAADLDDAVARAKKLGAQVMMEPAEYPGGRFAVLSDPQGAYFGLMTGGSA